MTTLQDIRKAGNFNCQARTLERLCNSVKLAPSSVYNLISYYGGEADSYTRETIFSYIADSFYNGDYDKIYLEWLHND